MDNPTVEKTIEVGDFAMISGEMPAEGEHFNLLHEGKLMAAIAMAYTPDGFLTVWIPEPGTERGSLIWVALEATI